MSEMVQKLGPHTTATEGCSSLHTLLSLLHPLVFYLGFEKDKSSFQSAYF